MPEHQFKHANLDNKTVQKILAAALECWTRDGYHGASLKDVAEEAGVAKSLLHYHFASKEHLLIELQAVYSRQVAEAVRARLTTSEPSLEAGFDALDQVWDAVVATRHQFPFMLEVWRASLQNQAVRERLKQFHAELLALFKEGIEMTLGPIAQKARMPPGRLAELLHVVISGIELVLFLDGDVARMRRVYEDVKHMVAWTLLPPQGGSS